MKVTQWWKLPSDESYPVMKVIEWWKLSLDESCLVMKVKIVKEVKRSDGLWRFACGDVLLSAAQIGPSHTCWWWWWWWLVYLSSTVSSMGLSLMSLQLQDPIGTALLQTHSPPIQCNGVMQCDAMQWCKQSNAMHCNVVQCNNPFECYAVQTNAMGVLHCTAHTTCSVLPNHVSLVCFELIQYGEENMCMVRGNHISGHQRMICSACTHRI